MEICKNKSSRCPVPSKTMNLTFLKMHREMLDPYEWHLHKPVHKPNI